MFLKRKITEEKKTIVDLNRVGKIAEQLQIFFDKNDINPMESMASMMILTEFIRRKQKVLPEDYNNLLRLLAKVK